MRAYLDHLPAPSRSVPELAHQARLARARVSSGSASPFRSTSPSDPSPRAAPELPLLLDPRPRAFIRPPSRSDWGCRIERSAARSSSSVTHWSGVTLEEPRQRIDHSPSPTTGLAFDELRIPLRAVSSSGQRAGRAGSNRSSITGGKRYAPARIGFPPPCRDLRSSSSIRRMVVDVAEPALVVLPSSL